MTDAEPAAARNDIADETGLGERDYLAARRSGPVPAERVSCCVPRASRSWSPPLLPADSQLVFALGSQESDSLAPQTASHLATDVLWPHQAVTTHDFSGFGGDLEGTAFWPESTPYDDPRYLISRFASEVGMEQYAR